MFGVITLAGFKKSLFGFDCDDVIEYIQKLQKKHSDIESGLNEKIENLNGTIELLNEKIDEINKSKAVLEAELQKYIDKQEEIERISENIGKLYLVSKSNAQTIMENAEESRKAARIEIEKNLAVIEQAHQALKEIKENVTNNSKDFSQKIDQLSNELEATKEGVRISSAESREKIAQFAELVNQ